MALKPLDDKYKIKRIVYSTYQAVSGAGRNGVVDLENGIENHINSMSSKHKSNVIDNLASDITNYSLEKFPHPIFQIVYLILICF